MLGSGVRSLGAALSFPRKYDSGASGILEVTPKTKLSIKYPDLPIISVISPQGDTGTVVGELQAPIP